MPRILLVDDDSLILHTVRRILKRAGTVEVDTAMSGAEALCCLAETAYDLIISDFSMPEMDGGEFFTEVRTKYPAMVGRFVFHTTDEERTEPFGVLTIPKCSTTDLRRVVKAVTV